MNNEEYNSELERAVELIHKYEKLTTDLCNKIEEMHDSMRAQAEFNARVNERLRVVDRMQHLFINEPTN